ncbi:bifunctional Sirtuin family/DHS-like NAD-FAD-binding domain superfamily/Sirtuin family [Babesia duncani]|uniref:protein acetyllysine N-acetyltransferase n=1 Tax=Babesia duncani TaxID=323732 RepID=A0AAD9UQ29_9APIC|nr:bifunctional Sirtuin family/DHS-like NAD-FAD-binding domain superfamily/Sirtuin family [Babesia duncani]
MATSALSYAEQLRRNDRKGPLGANQHFDTISEVNRKFRAMMDFLKASENAVVHTGAGVSTGSGIPDFRGPTGIWTVMSRNGKRRKMTDGDCTVRDQSENPVIYGKRRRAVVEFNLALPSDAHLAIFELVRLRKVAFVVTQNIDGLHVLSGLDFSQVSELHGNVFTERCSNCTRRFFRGYVSPTISFKPTGNLCGICTFPPSGILTDVVLDWFDRYESHFEKSAISNCENSDFHLTLGSSLHVEPACHYASIDHYRKQDSPLVIVNFQKTKLDPEADEVIHYDVNKICTRILKEFKIPKPTFIKRANVIILMCEIGNQHNAYIRLPCIKEVVVMKQDAEAVVTQCINSGHGIYKFTFTRAFMVNLKLFYNATLVLSFPYSSITLPKAYCWKIALAATQGGENVKTDSRLYKGPQGVDSEMPNIESLELSHNAHLIPNDECYSLIGILESNGMNTFENFTQANVPPSLNILTVDWCLVASSDFVNVSTLEIKSEKKQDFGNVQAPPQPIVMVKQEKDFGSTHSNGTQSKLQKVTELNPCLDYMMNIALQSGLATINNDQLMPNLDIQSLGEFSKDAAAKTPLTLWVCNNVKLGHLLYKVPKEIKNGQRGRYSCTTYLRIPGGHAPIEILFYTILKQSIKQILEHQASNVLVYKLINEFRAVYPLWVLNYVADFFECR